MSFLDHFSSMLTPWQWALLLAVPPAIVALYFLKLRRQPLEVPSTYLWHRTIEDLHVNSIWQRLRQNLLLFLQLLLLALLILACLRPSWRGTRLTDNRFIFLVDTSASMSARDVDPSRLDEARRQIEGLIQQMKPRDVAMLVSFSDRAQVEQPFTDNRRLLRRRLAEIQPTERPSDLDEALRVAAGLANPGRTGERGTADVPVAEPLPATLFIFSDGGFRTIPQFAMGNLKPVYVPIGADAPRNVAIVAFSALPHADQPERVQTFAQLENHGPEAVSVEVGLYRQETLLDAARVQLSAGGSGGVEFQLDQAEPGFLRLQIEDDDDLAIDNTASAVLNPPRRAQVLLVTPGNEPLAAALATEAAGKLADVVLAAPALLDTADYQRQAALGTFDLVIYDRCAPRELPQANTLFLGALPGDDRWPAAPRQSAPQILDIEREHPLMHYLEMGDVTIADGTPLTPPPGSRVLIDTDVGPLAAIGPREGFEDTVLGFELVGTDPEGKTYANTDWPIRVSFPVFWRNTLIYLGAATTEAAPISIQPGQPITLRSGKPVEAVRVRDPDGRWHDVPRGPQNAFLFGATARTGVYEVQTVKGQPVDQRFAVNLFDSTESDLRPRTELETQYEKISGSGELETTRREAWKLLLLAGLVVLGGEWYVYHRRVYLPAS